MASTVVWWWSFGVLGLAVSLRLKAVLTSVFGGGHLAAFPPLLNKP